MKIKNKINWQVLSGALKKPKNIALISVTIILIVISSFIITIYSYDEPSFIPEEIREEIRGAIIEKIGTPLQSISNPAGTFIIDAAHDKAKAYAYGKYKKETASWPTYTDEETGLSLKYPEGSEIEKSIDQTENYVGTISFWDKSSLEVNNGLPIYDIDIFAADDLGALFWVESQNIPEGIITEITTVSINGKEFIRAIEAGAPDHLIYVYKGSRYYYKFKTSFEEMELIENVLKTFKEI
jgi:hypothetical protein